MHSLYQPDMTMLFNAHAQFGVGHVAKFRHLFIRVDGLHDAEICANPEQGACTYTGWSDSGHYSVRASPQNTATLMWRHLLNTTSDDRCDAGHVEVQAFIAGWLHGPKGDEVSRYKLKASCQASRQDGQQPHQEEEPAVENPGN